MEKRMSTETKTAGESTPQSTDGNETKPAETSGEAGNTSKQESQQQPQVKKEYTQEQLTQMMTKEKKQGRASALKELGIDPKDEAAIERIKQLIASAKPKEEQEAEKKVQMASQSAEAERRILMAEAKVEAMRLGVQPQFVDDTITLVIANIQDGDDLKTLIGELKIKYPNWFEAQTDDKKNETGKKGTGTSMSGGVSGASGENKGLGERLAIQRKENQTKSSYWK